MGACCFFEMSRRNFMSMKETNGVLVRECCAFLRIFFFKKKKNSGCERSELRYFGKRGYIEDRRDEF